MTQIDEHLRPLSARDPHDPALARRQHPRGSTA